ncbi:MAG: hypothetical protein KBC21_03115 [Candidatus Pacebacteria bacterium]|nr:hypothetical protein [Candidatus Paceibacterota bacterium]
MEKFSTITGRESEVKILNKYPIGGGMRGDVYEAEVMVGNRTKKFIIKDFVDFDLHLPHETQHITAKQSAENALLNHGLAQEAGLRTLATYRLEENGKSILMSDARIEGKVLIDTNSRDRKGLESHGLEKLDKIEHFDELLEEIIEEAYKASNHGLVLWGDALFFLVDPDQGVVDFVVGDYDSLSYQARSKLEVSISRSLKSLSTFITYNVKDPQLYLAKIQNRFNGLRPAISTKG